MGALFHIAEVAALLLVAYAVGWAIGFVVHLLVSPRAKVETIPAERLAVAKGEPVPEDALVKAPTIVEVEKAPAPVKVLAAALPAGEPKPAEPMAAETVAPEPAPALPATPPGPKVSAIETLRSLSSAMPLLPVEPVPAEPAPAEPMAVVPTPPVSEPPAAVEPVAAPAVAASEIAAAVAEIAAAVADPAPVPAAPPAPAPVPEPEPVIAVVPPMPASAPGQAWSGQIHGHEAPPPGSRLEPAPQPEPSPVAIAPVTPAAEQPKVEVVEEPAGLEASLLSIVEAHLPPEIKTMPDPLEDMLMDSVAGGLALGAEAEAALAAPAPAETAPPAPMAEAPVAPAPARDDDPPPLVPEPVAVTPPPEPPYQPAPVEFDEAAAMRDIEGGWSRRKTRAMSDSTDVGAAVAAAQVAVENVLARNGVSADRQAGKPRALPGPRDGKRDDLKQINGLRQLDESTLNNLGIYHYEQIAAWTAAEVLWLENHAFARGRIGQENWQQQARVLVSDGAARRAAR